MSSADGHYDVPSTVDAAVRDPSTGRGELLLLETNPPVDPSERFTFIQKRLAAYIAYIDSGQYRDQFPTSMPDELVIRILYRVPPTPQLLAIEAVRASGAGGDELVTPVVLEAEDAMLARMRQANPETSNRPWWRFW